MSYNQQEIERLTATITPQFGDELTWRFEEKFSVMLSEFARHKKDNALIALRELFQHEWDKKSIKRAPKEITLHLGELSKLKKEQLVLARKATDNLPAMIALWWPWGHGSTYSLRIMVLEASFDFNVDEVNTGLLTKLKQLFS